MQAHGATFPADPRCRGTARTGVIMVHWSEEMRIDPVVMATVVFGVLMAALLVTTI